MNAVLALNFIENFPRIECRLYSGNKGLWHICVHLITAVFYVYHLILT